MKHFHHAKDNLPEIMSLLPAVTLIWGSLSHVYEDYMGGPFRKHRYKLYRSNCDVLIVRSCCWAQ